jgi:hypothetical protein
VNKARLSRLVALSKWHQLLTCQRAFVSGFRCSESRKQFFRNNKRASTFDTALNLSAFIVPKNTNLTHCCEFVN